MREGIGIFDSGLGGLTVMRKIRQKCPSESIIYYGDTARVPYGGKSPETILRYTIEGAIFLMEQKIKALVIACNTAASYSMERLKNIFPLPIIDVIGPGAEAATRATSNGRIAILGTKATIASGAYQREIARRRDNTYVLPLACPLFVPLVEESFLDHPATNLIVQEYLKPVKAAGVDTLLLGCTHYPVLFPLIQKELGPSVQIVDSATTSAEELASLLDQSPEALSPPSCRFFVSDDPEKFKLLGPAFLGAPIEACEQVRHELQAV
jgi:glutamate racemase